MKTRISSTAGFTLIELLVSMVFTFILMGVIYSVFRVQAHTVKAQEQRQEAQDYARAVIDIIVREIRNVASNPTGTTVGLNCVGTPVAGKPGIVSASATAFKFTYDYRGNAAGSAPDGNCDDPDEEVTYQYQSPGPQNCAGGLGDIVRIANGATEVLTDCNVSAFSFTYYAKDSVTAMSPIVLASIQRVSVAMSIQSKNADPEFGGQLTSTVSSNINLRNSSL